MKRLVLFILVFTCSCSLVCGSLFYFTQRQNNSLRINQVHALYQDNKYYSALRQYQQLFTENMFNQQAYSDLAKLLNFYGNRLAAYNLVQIGLNRGNLSLIEADAIRINIALSNQDWPMIEQTLDPTTNSDWSNYIPELLEGANNINSDTLQSLLQKLQSHENQLQGNEVYLLVKCISTDADSTQYQGRFSDAKIQDMCNRGRKAFTANDNLYLSYYLLRQDLNSFAEQASQNLINQYPSFYQGYFYKAVSLQHRQDYKGAQTWLTKALALAPTDNAIIYADLLNYVYLHDTTQVAAIIDNQKPTTFDSEELAILIHQLLVTQDFQAVVDLSKLYPAYSSFDVDLATEILRVTDQNSALRSTSINCAQVINQVDDFGVGLIYVSTHNECNPQLLNQLFEDSPNITNM